VLIVCAGCKKVSRENAKTRELRERKVKLRREAPCWLIAPAARGDEALVCSRLARFRAFA
jgi:hypothetical protein